MSNEKIDASVMIVDNHLPVANSHRGLPYINAASSMLLGLGAKTLSCKKGIQLRPEETFRYKREPKAEHNNERTPQEKHSLYLYEAGVSPEHAKTLNHDIMIYVTRDGEDAVLVGTLSAAHPWMRLEITLGEDCEIRHSSTRKTVFFNGFDFTLSKSPKLVCDKVVWMNTKSVTVEVDKELWVAEVCPSKELSFDPVDEEKEYHLLEVYSRESTDRNINLYVTQRQEPLGKIVAGCNRTKLNYVFDDKFTLSHTSNTTSVFFSGYTVAANQQFKLKELKKYSGDFEDSPKLSPKISVDPEYQCYKARLAKVPTGTAKEQPIGIYKQQEVNPVTMSPLTAPLIFDHRAGCQLISANPVGSFGSQRKSDSERWKDLAVDSDSDRL